MKANRWILIFCTAIAVSAVWITIPRLLWQPTIKVAGFPPIAYPGFQTWPTLRDFDGPGTIFSLTNGSLDVVGSVATSPTLAGNEFLGELRSTANWNAGVLQQFLTNALLIKATSDTKINVEFEPANVERWRVREGNYSDQIKEIARRNKDATLFFITESISVRGIKYRIEKGTLLEVKPTFQHDKFGTLELTQANAVDARITVAQTFNKPFYIFYKARKINILSGLAEAQVLFTDLENENLRWSQEVPTGDVR